MQSGAILSGKLSRLFVLLLTTGIFFLGATWAEAQNAQGAKGAAKTVKRDLDGWGKMGSKIRGTDECYNFTLYKKDEKGRMKPQKVILVLGEDTPIYYDKPIRLEDLKSGNTVYVLGRAVSREVRGQRGGGGGLGGGRGGKDQQIQNSKVLLTGKGVEVNEKYKSLKPEEKDIKWHKTTVNKATGGLSVTSEGAEHRVTLGRGAPILRRAECERKLLRSGRYIHVLGDKTEPPSDADEKAIAGKSVFAPKRVVIFDPRYLKTAYEAIFR